MNTTIELTRDEEHAMRMTMTNRFFIMTTDGGEFAKLNPHGKATRFAFVRKFDAMLRVEWSKGTKYAFDNKTKERLF